MLQEVFAKLIMYNYASLIAREESVPDGKQVNFSAAVDICRQYFKNHILVKNKSQQKIFLLSGFVFCLT